jgi:hypothetical protein
VQDAERPPTEAPKEKAPTRGSKGWHFLIFEITTHLATVVRLIGQQSGSLKIDRAIIRADPAGLSDNFLLPRTFIPIRPLASVASHDQIRPQRMAAVVHIAERAHFVDKQTLAAMNTAIMLALVGSGFAACVIGALIYDVGRLLPAG